MLRKWLKAGYVETRKLFATDAGTPQGGIISPVLANLALDGLERRIREAFPRTSRRGLDSKVHIVRYADDVRRFTRCSIPASSGKGQEENLWVNSLTWM